MSVMQYDDHLYLSVRLMLETFDSLPAKTDDKYFSIGYFVIDQNIIDKIKIVAISKPTGSRILL